MIRLEISRIPWVQTLLRNRWPQFLVRAVTFSGVIFTILAGLMGPLVGSYNFAVIFVWIAWWTALKLFFIPFGGRSWCSICPIPMSGEWLQRGGLITRAGKGWGMGKRWPRFFRGNWLQAWGFIIIGLFSAVTLTSARLTAFVLLFVVLLALVLSLIFERRSFCNYLCPIGGFIGLYAQTAPLELRVKDPAVCAEHTEKSCYINCPWGVYPLTLKTNTDCGLCMECLRVCSKDNIAVNLRPFGEDLKSKNQFRLDEVFLGLVMLSSVLIDSAIFLGSWGDLKSAAFAVGSIPWWIFVAAFLLVSLGILPGLYIFAVWIGVRLSGERSSLKQALSNQGQALIPLGLMAWIAFTVSFAFVKFSYVLPVLSDPLGLGWNLFGSAHLAWVGESTPFTAFIQVIILLVGLFWSFLSVWRASESSQPIKQAIPMIGFCFLFTLSMLWLLIG
ncbi:MAG: 4Fe-4S binding protein [Chloroflexota bacterium]